MARPLWTLGIATLGEAYRTGDVTPDAVLAATLERIEEVNGTLNVFACLDTGGAREAAAASTARARDSRLLGPLDGIVVTIKDNITVRGLPCVWGTELFRDYVPAADELPVARLRAAGAVILGKTNVSEFTLGRGTVSTPMFGTTRNPWDPDLTTGASSGGAAAATAAGIGAGALGTDGGGSIRRPASHCGVVGLKPSTGRVPRRDGLPVILHDCEVIGPLARNIDDLAALYAAIAGPDPLDRASLAFREAPTGRRLDRALRIAHVPIFGDDPVDADVARACKDVAEALVSLGHNVERVTVPFDLATYRRCWPVVSQSGMAWLLRDRAWQGRIGEFYVEMVQKGNALSAADYVDALTGFRQIQAELGRFFAEYDLLLTPAAGAVPWPAERAGPAHERAFTGFANAAGVPALSIPSRPTDSGMPVGVQLVASFGSEDLLFEVGRALERMRPWQQVWDSRSSD
jgi:aspartyl-tRNA(Asn)/glutamyl-tRNA(Gln) amidotransferase subunit A